MLPGSILLGFFLPLSIRNPLNSIPQEAPGLVPSIRSCFPQPSFRITQASVLNNPLRCLNPFLPFCLFPLSLGLCPCSFLFPSLLWRLNHSLPEPFDRTCGCTHAATNKPTNSHRVPECTLLLSTQWRKQLFVLGDPSRCHVNKFLRRLSEAFLCRLGTRPIQRLFSNMRCLLFQRIIAANRRTQRLPPKSRFNSIQRIKNRYIF